MRRVQQVPERSGLLCQLMAEIGLAHDHTDDERTDRQRKMELFSGHRTVKHQQQGRKQEQLVGMRA